MGCTNQSNDALKDALAYSQNIIATLREPFVVLGSDLRVKTANRSFYESFHVSREIADDQLVYDLGNGQWDIPRLRTLLNEVLSKNDSVHDVEVVHSFPHIGQRTVLLNARKFAPEAGDLELILVAIKDVTEQRLAQAETERSEIRYRRLFESARDGILILDAHTGTVIDSNPFMTALLGYSHREFLGKELWEIGMFRDIEESRAAYRTLQEKGYVRYENLPLETRYGQPVEVEFVSNVYSENHRQVAQCNIRDISERSRLERKMKDQAEALADFQRRKDEFLAMLSHELRNPLAPIVNAVQMLQLEQANENAIQHQARTVIDRQVGQFARIVDDLLEVSRITSGRLQLRQEIIAVTGVVEHGVATVRSLIDHRKHELTVSLPIQPIWVYADAARLEQIVVNLLTNATKYTDEGGHLWLAVQLDGDEMTLRVRDSGIGIAPEILPRIFELFTQADRSLDRAQGGLGIGLALVQRLVVMHRGWVEAHSVLGQGSEFVVHLPTVPPPEPQPLAPRIELNQAIGPSLRVLVVDDEVDTAQSLAFLLRAWGHDVRTAYDGPTALEVALDYSPNVALLDLGLPELDGYEVAKQMRQQASLSHILLVALTGYGNEAERQRSQKSGFDHHLVKPTPFGKLKQILATLPQKAT